MKQYIKSIITLCSILIFVAILIGGCSLTGMQRSGNTSTTMETMDKDIRIVVAQLDITGASLKALMRPNQQEIKKTYSSFKENVSQMESKEKDFIKHSYEMKKRGKEYFAEWEKEGNQYKNPQIQALSEQRREELGNIYNGIAENSVGVKEAYKIYLSDIREMQIYLSNDLTSKGIETISPVAIKILSDGVNLKNALLILQKSINKAREEMSQSGR